MIEISFVEFYDTKFEEESTKCNIICLFNVYTCNQEITASSSTVFVVYCDKENKQPSIGLRSNS